MFLRYAGYTGASDFQFLPGGGNNRAVTPAAWLLTFENPVCPSGHCASRKLRENAAVAELTQPLVRAAMQADAETVCGIYNAALTERRSTFETEPRSAQDFADRIEDRDLPFLVVGTPEAIGWAALAPYSSRPCYAGIAECSVYVAAAARGRGVGTALTEALAASAGDRGFHKLIGKIFTDNTASVRLIERCGFTSVGLHRRHGQLEGKWRDVLVVERLLELAQA
jgi:L-amino acid N-acyltransferase YncA